MSSENLCCSRCNAGAVTWCIYILRKDIVHPACESLVRSHARPALPAPFPSKCYFLWAVFARLCPPRARPASFYLMPPPATESHSSWCQGRAWPWLQAWRASRCDRTRWCCRGGPNSSACIALSNVHLLFGEVEVAPAPCASAPRAPHHVRRRRHPRRVPIGSTTMPSVEWIDCRQACAIRKRAKEAAAAARLSWAPRRGQDHPVAPLFRLPLFLCSGLVLAHVPPSPCPAPAF
jgi:hypothetical protein